MAHVNLSVLQKRIKQLEERVPSENLRYIEIQRFSDEDKNYISDLADIAFSPSFRFFLYDAREKIIDAIELTKANDSDRRNELFGELKGIGIIRKNLEHVVSLSEKKKDAA